MRQWQAKQDQIENLWLQRIIKQGSYGRQVTFPVTFPERGVWPQEGTAWFIADPNQSFPLFSGMIKGTIRYFGQSFHEMQFEQKVSLLLPEIPVLKNTETVLAGRVKEVAWRPDLRHTHRWIVEVIIDFSWYLTKTALLTCRIGSSSVEPVAKIKASQLLSCQNWQFLHLAKVAAIPGVLTEVRVVLGEKKETWTKKGLLLTTKLSIEAYFAHSSGKEVYQNGETEFNELITADRLPFGIVLGVKPETLVTATVQNYHCKAGQLCVAVSLDYECRFWQDRVANVVLKPGAVCNVLALTLREPGEFKLTGQAQLRLRQRPLQIQNVKTELTGLAIVPQTGRINVQGQQEVLVTYCDQMQRQRTDIYQLLFRESYHWGAVVPGDQFEYQARLEWDEYTLTGQQVCYRYWWQLHINGGQLEALPLKLDWPQLSGENGSEPVEAGVEHTQEPLPIRLIIERELALPAEISAMSTACQITLEQFQCYDAGKAFRVEGWFRIELEAAERGPLSRCEYLRLHFWHFAPYQGVPLALLQQFQAQIRCWDWRLRDAGTWSKRQVKLRVEIELQPREGGADPGFTAKSD